MLAVILKILSILGIILLVILGIIVLVLLLVLFMPIVYKINAQKTDKDIMADVRARWLFGFARAKYAYPEPGRFVVKILWKTIYDSGEKKSEKAEEKEKILKGEDSNASETLSEKQISSKEEIHMQNSIDNNTVNAFDEQQAAEESVSESADAVMKKTVSEKLFEKYEKIKYTMRQFCDKIKHIWDNITFYKKLLQDEQTKLLISHVFERVGKIIRHIRPRKLKADILFGTGSPDTTGYAYGIYGMFSPHLGKNVFVTPDFTQSILIGEIHAAGYITVFTLLINALSVLLDKRLRIFINRLKNHSAKQNKQAKLKTI